MAKKTKSKPVIGDVSYLGERLIARSTPLGPVEEVG